MRLNKRRMKHVDSNYKVSHPSTLYESVYRRFSSALLISVRVKENRNIVQYCNLIHGHILIERVVRQMPGFNSQVGARSALFKSSCHCVVLSSFCCYCVVLLFVLFCYYCFVLCIDCVYCNTATGC